MVTYVMSDLHGCFDEFQSLLEKIGFTDEDRLILAGDLIERGPKNYEMLRWLEQKPDNVYPVLGNHENEFARNVGLMSALCEQLREDPADPDTAAMICGVAEGKSLFFDYYGCISGLIRDHTVTLNDFTRWADMFSTWPCQRSVRIRGREFIIVHAGYIEDLSLLPKPGQYSDLREFNLYAREEAYLYGGKAHTTIISGHTPTVIRHSFTSNNGNVFRYHDEDRDRVIYDIDCGGVFRYWGETASQFACIRLEDESITYV